MTIRLFLVLGFLALSPTLTYAASDFYLGIGTHLYGQDITKDIFYLHQSGANSFRDDTLWYKVESLKNRYVTPAVLDNFLLLAESNNIVPLLILDYGNKLYGNGGKPVTKEEILAFSNFADFYSKKLIGKRNILEIWNEWEHSKEPTSPESYFELVKSVSPRIKINNKDTIVLAGSANIFGNWTENLVRLGVLNYVDGISIHPYMHCESDSSPETWAYMLREFSERLTKANGGNRVPLYITEMGWPSHTGTCGTHPIKVAQYLVRALLLVRTFPEIKGFWWYDLVNDGNKIEEMEHNFGLLDHAFTPKPAYYSFEDISNIILSGRSFKMITSSNGLVVMEIINNHNVKEYAIWSKTNNIIKANINIVSTRGKTASIREIGYIKENKMSKIIIGKTPVVIKPDDVFTIVNDIGRVIPELQLLKNGVNSIMISPSPLLVTDADWLSVI
jgi:hypothetical protein